VALFIGLATMYFNAKQADRQTKFQEIDAIAKMMPYLTSEKPTQVAWALQTLVALGYQIPAANLAINAGQVGAQVLTSLSKEEDPAVKSAAQEAQKRNAERTRDVQTRLKALSLYDGAVDGSFNPQLDQAIRNFQKRQGMDADGIVGPVTYSKLEAATARPPNMPPTR
jgi:murein L,D-transpeptidase YcbB/YkuD